MSLRSMAILPVVGLLSAAALVIIPQRAAFAQANTAAAAPQQTQTGSAPERAVGLFAEPHFISGAFDFLNDKVGDKTKDPKSGFYPEVSNMLTGSGWVSLGPGYRHYFWDDRWFVEGSGAVSWRMYAMAQARVEFPKLAHDHLAVGVQNMWQGATQVNFFGIGPDSSEDDRTQYQLQTYDVVGYANYKVTDSFTISQEVGWLARPRFTPPGGTFKRDLPFTREVFPTAPGPNLSVQPALLHTESALTADTRDHRGHPTSGFLYRAALTTYDDKDSGNFNVQEYEAEGLQLIPLVGKNWILALHGWTIHSNVSSGNAMPIYLMPAIGGGNTLRSFADFRFHDNNILVANAESRWAVWEHLDAALFLDAGNVAARYGDLNLNKTSVGAGLRLHTDTTTFARLDVAHGSEGWRVLFRTSDPLRLGRARKEVAIIPFAP
jgi:Omp85 superfamily domain